jgi:hypothetical protein
MTMGWMAIWQMKVRGCEKGGVVGGGREGGGRRFGAMRGNARGWCRCGGVSHWSGVRIDFVDEIEADDVNPAATPAEAGDKGQVRVGWAWLCVSLAGSLDTFRTDVLALTSSH